MNRTEQAKLLFLSIKPCDIHQPPPHPRRVTIWCEGVQDQATCHTVRYSMNFLRTNCRGFQSLDLDM